jgi:protein TonB
MRQGATYGVAGAVAMVIHLGLGASLAGVNPKDWANQTRNTVEMDVLEPPPPPPPPPPPEPEPPPPPPPKTPRLAMRRPVETPPPEPARPPPSENPEPPKEDAPPTFGVSIDSTVSGDSSMAVPVGNTVATNDRTPRPPAPPSGPPGPPAFAPVSESFVAEMPRVLAYDPKEKNGENFPEEARRLKLEGKVTLRLGIDRRGMIRSVKVVKGAGYGFDEAAIKSLKVYKWAPAKDNKGGPVDMVITYGYTFSLPN